MTIHFNADEVLEMAEQIERNGAKFYRQAAQGLPDVGAQQKLLRLAAMEEKHERTFHSLREDLSGREGVVGGFDPTGEAVRYLQAMVNGQVFDLRRDPSERLKGKESVEDVLRMAIGLERDSIVFYQGIRDLVAPGLNREKVEANLKEEMGHLTLLSGELTSLRQ